MADNAECVLTNLDYQVLAKNITLWSETSAPDQDATRITISALGAGSPLNNGAVAIEANGAIALDCGESFLHLSQDKGKCGVYLGTTGSGVVLARPGDSAGTPRLILNGASGYADLSVGTLTLGSALTVKSDKLSLGSGPQVGGAAVELSASGLTLKFAAWSIKMSAAGIDLAVGPNKISLQPSGVSINGMTLDLVALTRMSLQAMQMEQQASVQWTAAPSTIKML